MDIEKAFDRVWFDGLIHKLIQINTPQYLVKLINDFLRNRSFQVNIAGVDSTRRNLNYGLPQGAVLSPLLYIIYTYDQPELRDTKAALFADDTSLRTTSRYAATITKRLEASTKKYIRYFTRWKIKPNADKFQAVFVTKRRTKQLPRRPLHIDNSTVEWQPRAKYLGVVIDKRMTLKDHFDYVLQKSQKALRMFYSLLCRRSKLSINNKLNFYKVGIRPIFSYACPVTSSAAATHIKRLQVFQNKTLRMILDIRWDPEARRYPMSNAAMHRHANIEFVADHFNRLHNNFHFRINERSDDQHL